MKINFSSIEHENIKKDLIQFLSTQNEFKDWNFQASGITVLIDTLAYITHYIAYYANVTVNELFLDSSIVRKNIISLAKSLGYTPHRKRAAVFDEVEVEIINPTYTSLYSSITIPKFTNFASDLNKNFLLPQIVNFSSTSDTPWKNKVKIIQGNNYSFIKKSSLAETKFQKIIIPYTDVAENYLNVYVEDVDGDYIVDGVNYKLWRPYNNIDDLSSNSEIYFIYEGDNQYPVIMFGDNVFGKIPDGGKNILIEFVRTEGVLGNNLTSLIPTNFTAEASDGLTTTNIPITVDDIKITLKKDTDGAVIPSNGGAEIESNDSIKRNAPRFYASQGRAVTSDDYISIISKWDGIGNILSHSVWGGEEEVPQKYGTVFIAVQPAVGNELNEDLKLNLINHLKSYNVLTITPEIVNPVFIFIGVNSIVRYNASYSESSLISSISDKIDKYFEENVKGFESYLKYSRFVAEIDSVNGVYNNITSLSLFTTFRKSVNDFYRINLYNTLQPNSIRINVSSSESDYGVEYNIQDDGNGIINEVIGDDVKPIGEVDYSFGVIKINNYPHLKNNIEYKLFFDTFYEDVKSEKNIILKLNTKTIVMEGVTSEE